MQHIALEVTTDDISDFYIDVLGGQIKRQFTLDADVADAVFGKKQEVDVCMVEVGAVVLELFVVSVPSASIYNHSCVTIANTAEVFEKARQNQYWTYLLTRNSKETFFIKDRNGNMFELKTNIQ